MRIPPLFLFVLSPSTKFPCPPCDPWIFFGQPEGQMFWSSEDRVRVPFHGTFSRHGRIKASFILLIWLIENVRFHYAESRQNKPQVNLLGKSCLRCCLRQEIICNSGRQQTKSLTKISTENALEYLASGTNFYGDRLRLEFLEQRRQSESSLSLC